MHRQRFDGLGSGFAALCPDYGHASGKEPLQPVIRGMSVS